MGHLINFQFLFHIIQIIVINSGVGLHPKQFKSYLQETVNVDLTVLIMTNVKALKSNMDTKKITL